MPAASFLQTAFTGGEISQTAQGRADRPDYRHSMNVCLNTIPVEAGAALRRPGTEHLGVTRGGLAAKIIAYDFDQRFPHIMELTDGFIRFRSDGALDTTNDAQTVTSISASIPAELTTSANHGWSTGDTVFFTTLATPINGKLDNRQFHITVTAPDKFTIADDVTGDLIDGSTLGSFSTGTIARVHELATPFGGTSWQNVRSVQAETSALLLNGALPQVLSVGTPPTPTTHGSFNLEDADFIDGPYLDPFPGSEATASALSGVVTVTLSFQPYDAARAYNVGDYVTSAGQGYKSLTAANQNHTPASSPTNWLAVNAGDPINDGAGLNTGDVGRLIRLFSEPSLWVAATSYTTGQVVAYTIGDTTGYWQATGSTTGDIPGTSSKWAVVSGVGIARWTWGRILSVSAAGLITPVAAIGDMTGSGGLSAAFDGITSKSFASSATVSQATPTAQVWSSQQFSLGFVIQYAGGIYLKTNIVSPGDPLYLWEFLPPPGNPLWTQTGTASNVTLNNYCGQHYSVPTAIAFATVIPTVDVGFANNSGLQLNLRASASPPSSASDGTLLATTIALNTGPVTLISSDQVTVFNYVWIETISNYIQPLPDNGSHSFTCQLGFAQVQFYAPNVNNGSVMSVQIVGDPLLYSNACRTWRLGAYGGSGGYPKCGTYHEGRIWLSGVIGNRVDSSKSNVIRNGVLVLDMAPTSPSGTVADDNAITATATGPDVNSIFWMMPDQQGIICGSLGGEWLIAPSSPGALSPTNTSMRRVTKIGCADQEPARTDHTLVFAQKFQRQIMEYFADVYSGKFSAPSLSDRSRHLTRGEIAQIAYQQEKTSVVWARLNTGGLIGITYQRDSLTTSKGPDISAAHRHTLGSGRSVTSIAVSGSNAGTLDSLYLVTNDADGVHHVERLMPMLDEGFNYSDVWFLDDAIAPTLFNVSSTPATNAPYGGLTLYGLWPHEGQNVSAYVAGLDCGDYTVTDGAIFIPFGDGVSGGTGSGLFTQTLVQSFAIPPAVVGFTYNSDGQIVRPLRPDEAGLPSPSLGMSRRTHMFAALLHGAVTGTISFGTTFSNIRAAAFKTPGEQPYTVQQQYSGVCQGTIEADSDFDNMLCWRQSRPNAAAFVIAVEPNLHTQGR